MPSRQIQRIRRLMMRLMVRVMPSCKDVSELISEGMDHDLPLRKRLAIRLHVSMCSLCRRYETQLHLLRRGFGCYAAPEKNAVAKSLSPEAKERLEKALQDGIK